MVKSVTYPTTTKGILKTEYTYDNMNRVYDDNLNRLKTAEYGDGNIITYEYDSRNNIEREYDTLGNVKVYSYDNKNRLIRVTVNGNVTDEYTYTDNGEVLTHNNTSYTYDEWNRLVNFTDENGNATAQIIYGHKPLARKMNGQWYYYIYNVHGDVIGKIDQNGDVKNSYSYDAWGKVRSKTETVENPIRYCGEYFDEETGLYYLRARYYDPTVGRFISEDPAEDGLNWYVYCGNNPVMFVDPSGLVITFSGNNSDDFLKYIRQNAGDSRYDLNKKGELFINTDMKNTLTGGSPTFVDMLKKGMTNNDVIIIKLEKTSTGSSLTRCFSDGIEVMPSLYTKDGFNGNRNVEITIHDGKNAEFDLVHELSHGLDWVLRNDQKVIYANGANQADIYNKYTEARAITLTNQVAFERGISYRDSYYRYTMFINGIAVPNPNPIYGMYPFEYSKGKAAVMRYLEYGIDIYERYLYFRN